MDNDLATNPYAGWSQLDTYVSLPTRPGPSNYKERARRQVPPPATEDIVSPGPSAGRLTFPQIQQLGRSRRPPLIECQWKDCSARLATSKLLDKHLEIHVRRSVEQRCKWFNCTQTFRDSCELKDHVHSHTNDIEFCPFKSCQHPLYRGESHFLRRSPDHPLQPWTKNMLHPPPDPTTPILSALPPLLTSAVPTYLIICQPVKPGKKPPIQLTNQPDLDDVPFLPASSRSRHEVLLWSSSDIYPHEEDLLEPDPNTPHLHPPPSSDEETRVLPSLRPKSTLRAPIIPEVLDWQAWKRQVGRKLTATLSAREATDLAAKRWAQYHAGRSVGIGFWAHHSAFSSSTPLTT